MKENLQFKKQLAELRKESDFLKKQRHSLRRKSIRGSSISFRNTTIIGGSDDFNTLKMILFTNIIIAQRKNSTQQSKNLHMYNIIMYIRILIMTTKRLMRLATESYKPCDRN